MQIEDIVEQYPKTVMLKDHTKAVLRPLKSGDEKAFHKFFCEIPETERLLFKNRVTDAVVIRDWCRKIDYGRILPLLAVSGAKVVADASLHQSLGGWKRHIGRVSVVVHPAYRGKGLARSLISELIAVARDVGLEFLQAEFMGEQKSARKIFAELGFAELLTIPEYVKDMQAIKHEYVLMGRGIKTDEEYASAL
jgi:GNAT superfamily N-acetyltransferase